MGALLLAEALVAGATDLHLHHAAVTCVVLAVTALFWWGIHFVSFPFGRRPAEREMLRTPGPAGAAPTGSASRSPFLPLIVLCIATGAALHAEPLVAAAAEHHLHPAVVLCVALSVAALVNWAILSLNFAVVAVGSSNLAHSALIVLLAQMLPKSPNYPMASDGNRKESRPTNNTQPTIAAPLSPPPTAAVRSSRFAGAAFLVLAALMSASWFIEPFAAAAASELELSRPAVVATVVLFATCFYASVHLFRSFFLTRPPPAAAAAPQWDGVAAISAVAIGVLTCLVAGGGSAYGHATAQF
uniref:Uncharacterized protein n=1 Tax=Arundo donax TaxID=35708 RepID=A0A0A8ZEV3_ARUDO